MDDRDEPDGEAERDPELPESLGHYSILSELGRGGQGQVLLAHDTQLDRRVAIKILPPTVGYRHGERFKREAALASRLDHPGICPIYDAGEINGTEFIAMRYVEGETLADLIAVEKQARTESSSIAPSSRADLQDTLRLFESAARALHAAHEAGLVHRDIKPGNIMVDAQGNPVIVDFGLAHDETSEKEQRQLTFEGDLLGTPAYMSPEQLLAQRIRLDRRTDIYSLGITLFECLTLQLPFDAPTRDGLYKEILTSQIPDPTRINRSLSKDLKIIIETACDKDRDRRYQTAEDLAEDLRRVREFKPIRARPMGALLRFRRWTQRRPAVATAVLALFLLLAVGLGISLMALEEVRDREAQIRRQETETRKTAEYARALALAAESKEVLATSPYLALLLAREAVDLRPTARGQSALVQALGRVREVAEIRFDTKAHHAVTVFPGDRFLAWTPGDTVLRIFDFEGHEVERFEHPYPVEYAIAHKRGKHLVTRGYEDDQMLYWRVGHPAPVPIEGAESNWTSGFNAEGTKFVTGDGETCRTYDESGRFLAEVDGSNIRSPFQGGDRSVVFSNDDERGSSLVDFEGNELVRFAHKTLTWTHDGTHFFAYEFNDDKVSGAKVYSRDGALVTTFEGTRVWFLQTVPTRVVVTTDERITVRSLDGEVLVEVPGNHIGTYPGRSPLPGETAFVDTIASYNEDDGTLHLFDLDGSETSAFEVAKVTYVYVAGDRLILNEGGTTRLRDRSGAVLADLPAYGRYSGDHLVLADYSEGAIRVYDRDGAETAVCRGHEGWASFRGISADGTRLLTSGGDGTVRIWDIASTRIPTLREQTGTVYNRAFLADGTRVATRATGFPRGDKDPRLFDRSGAFIARLSHDESPDADKNTQPTIMYANEAGTRLLTVSYLGKTARLWDPDGGLLSRFDDAPVTVAWFLGDERIATIERPDDESFTARVWDRNGRAPIELGTWAYEPQATSFHPLASFAGDRFLTMSDEPGRAQLLDASGRVITVLDHRGEVMRTNSRNPNIYAGRLANGNLLLVTKDDDGRAITLYDKAGRRVRDPLRIEKEQGGYIRTSRVADRFVTWTKDQHGYDLWDLDGNPVATLETDAPVQGGPFLSDLGRITATAQSRTVYIWGPDGAPLDTMEGTTGNVLEALYAADDTRVVYRHGGATIPVRDADGKLLFELRGHGQAVMDIDLSPDGQLIATASRDGTARLWTLDGEPLLVMGGFGPVTGVTFAPDGTSLLVTYFRSAPRLWPIDVEAMRQMAEEALYRDFTDDERARYAELLGR